MKTLYWCMISNVVYVNRMFFMFRLHKWKIFFVCWIVWLNMAGNNVKLQTFKNWNLMEFGFKILEENGISYVNYVWCKICAKNKECINKFPLSKANLKMLRMFLQIGQTTLLSTCKNSVTNYCVFQTLTYIFHCDNIF